MVLSTEWSLQLPIVNIKSLSSNTSSPKCFLACVNSSWSLCAPEGMWWSRPQPLSDDLTSLHLNAPKRTKLTYQDSPYYERSVLMPRKCIFAFNFLTFVPISPSSTGVTLPCDNHFSDRIASFIWEFSNLFVSSCSRSFTDSSWSCQFDCLDHMSLAKLPLLQVSEGWEEGYVSFQYSKLSFKSSSVRIDPTTMALTIWD